MEEAGIISGSMSDWASPIVIVPKKEEHVETGNNTSGSKNSKVNLWLCINYRKHNSQIQTAYQMKTNGSFSKVISNYPLPVIDCILAWFNGCIFFSMIDLRSGYYHICLTKKQQKRQPLSQIRVNLCYSQMCPNIVILVSFTRKRHHTIQVQRSTSSQ